MHDLLKDKIAWYTWRRLQNELCKEYHISIHDTNYKKNVENGILVCIKSFGWWNDRYLSCSRRAIRNLNRSEVAELPKKYNFSNGTRDRSYIVNGRLEFVYVNPLI